MIKPVINVDYRTTDQLLNLAKIQSGRSMQSMVKDLLYYAGQSAVKLTPPGKSTLKGLPKKYRIRKIKKGYVKVLDKKRNKFVWHKDNGKNHMIPGAGAAKAGWVQALRDIGNMQGGDDSVLSKIGYGRMAGTAFSGYTGLLVNQIKYGPKIAAGVPAAAMASAERRLIGKIWREQKAKIEGGK